MYKVKAHYYADQDQFGESFILTSDNSEKDLRLEIGTKVKIVILCNDCEEKEADCNWEGKEYLCEQCFYKKFQR